MRFQEKNRVARVQGQACNQLVFGHGGTNYHELNRFLKAGRNKPSIPIDVYDSVIMSVVIPLCERSIAEGGARVDCPDFTHGQWKTKKSTFAAEGRTAPATEREWTSLVGEGRCLRGTNVRSGRAKHCTGSGGGSL